MLYSTKLHITPDSECSRINAKQKAEFSQSVKAELEGKEKRQIIIHSEIEELQSIVCLPEMCQNITSVFKFMNNIYLCP